jgi:coenzyme F420-reducing hydrogenase alpha subunit
MIDPQQIERASYLAAHALMTRNTTHPEFACPGTRRSRMIDDMAQIIRGVFEMQVIRSGVVEMVGEDC